MKDLHMIRTHVFRLSDAPGAVHGDGRRRSLGRFNGIARLPEKGQQREHEQGRKADRQYCFINPHRPPRLRSLPSGSPSGLQFFSFLHP